MKIIYIHQHFVTSQGSSGTRSYAISKYLIEMGHEVTIVCGLHDQSSLARMPWWRPYRTAWIDGIKVVSCNVPYSNKMSIPQRLWALFGFALLGSVAVVFRRRVDLVFATSPPLEVSLPGSLAALAHRAPLVFEVRDLWPEDLVDAGRIKRNGLGARLQGMLERYAYAVASRTLVVSRGFYDRLLERGYPPESLQTVLLGGDGALFKDIEPDKVYLQGLGLAEKFVAVYAGAHGPANGLGQVLDAAEHLRDRPDIALLLIGEGKQRASLLEEVRRRGLRNVHMQPSVPKVRLPGILTACDVGLLILTQISRPRWVTPNKLFDYMFAGLPTIVNFAGTCAQLVIDEKTGTAPEPGSAEDLAAAIRYYADHPDERRAIGTHARELAWKRYDRKQIAEQLAEVFEGLLRR